VTALERTAVINYNVAIRFYLLLEKTGRVFLLV
jgi:hypothetical protein